MRFPHTQSAGSLAEYLALVETVWQSWSAPRAGTLADIWFRGHADAAWPLTPGAHRAPFDGFSEHRLRHDFLLRAQPFLGELAVAPRSDWDWYFLMQHYGVPTRLLDWTESALVALYFALLPAGAAGAEPDACVWLLDPRRVNTVLAGIGDFVPIYSDAQVAPYLPRLWDESEAGLPQAPLAIDPPANSPRLAAQRGKFTVHGLDRAGLQGQRRLGDGLQRIRIPARHKPALRRQFLVTGVSEGTLFPGLGGVAADVVTLYGRTWAR